jgi:predicted lipase
MDPKNIDLSTCVRLAKLAYTNKDITNEYCIKIGNNPVSVEIVTDSSTAGARMYAIKNENTLIFTFRGANIINSIEKDTQTPFLDIICANGFPRNKYKDIKVHKNFLTQFTSLKFGMMDIINAHKEDINKITNIMCIGYSLGGALATLAATCCKSHYPNYIVWCVTFGSPRVGNLEFSKYFNDVLDLSKRIVYGDDILTKIPYYFYKHVGDKVEIGEHDRSIFKRYFGTLEDNNIDKYIECIVKNDYLCS